MIQRIQSVWLLIAALLTAGLFGFDMYHAHTLVNGVDTLVEIRVNNDYLQLLLALIITLLPFAAIFMFKNRKRQQNLIMLTLVLTLGFLAYMVIKVTNLNNQVPQPTKGSYWIGAVLPVISMVFLIMANNGIKKDEKLVKSLDRLR
jgi:hypothetical protein